MNSLPVKTPRAVIADDERLMRDQLLARLQQVWPELEIVAEAKNGLEAVQAVKDHQPDVVFLDIRMPGLTGVEAAKEIAQLDLGEEALLPEMVFITAYDQYAIEAFEQGVVDYVLKPAEIERLQRTVERLKSRLVQRMQDAQDTVIDQNSFQEGPTNPAISDHSVQKSLHMLAAQIAGKPAQYLSWLQAGVGQSIQLIPVDQILYCMSDDKYTRVQTAKREFLIRKPIRELVEELNPSIFLQIHRSTLVNLNAIEGVVRDERGRQEVIIKERSEKLQVSRSAAPLFRAM
jgi:DNA-binding LytR/AlgR family response regulator